MALTLTSAQRDAIANRRLKIRMGLKLELDSGTIGFWNDFGSLTYDSVSYTGTGQLASIAAITQQGDLAASGLECTLAGLDQASGADVGAIFSDIDDEDFSGRAATLYRFYFDPDTGRMDAADLSLTVQLFKGFIDRIRRTEVAVESEGMETMSSALVMHVESSAMEYGRRNITYRSNESQQAAWSGDKFFEFTPLIRDRQIYWGRAPQTAGGGGAPPGGSTHPGGDQPSINLR